MMRFIMMLMKRIIPIIIFIVVNLLNVDCTPTCAAEQFYDEDIPGCDYCYIICDHPEITNTLEKCLKKCPDFQRTKNLAPATTVIALTTAQTDNTSGAQVLTEQIVAIVVPVILFIAVVGVLCWMLKRRKKTPGKAKYSVQAEDPGCKNAETVPGVGQHDSLISGSTSTVEDCCV